MTSRRANRASCGYFGIVVWHPKTGVNVGTLWRSALVNGAAFVGTVGARYTRQCSDTPGTSNHLPLVHYTDLNDLIEHLPHGCPLVAVELDDLAKPLPQFTHPRQACYLLGAEDHGLPSTILQRCHYIVQVPTVRDWSMNVAVAGSIVMYDRLVKEGR